jgi:type IV pilus assembly protein PilA
MARELHFIPPVTSPPRPPTERGFTLIELMIVIVIVGVLAVLAVVGYRKLVLSAHTSEATGMIQSIRTAQEAYHAETQTYVSTCLSVTPGGCLYPNVTPSNVKTGWGGGISGPCPALPAASINCWSALPLHVDSAVMYGYATMGGVAGNVAFPALPLINGSAIGMPAAAPMDWYFIGAMGDVDANGVFTTVIGSSFTNDLFIDKEGE